MFLGPAYCDEWHTMTAGFLVSPDSNSDGVYESNLDCWYTIVAAEGLVVQLAVLDIDMFGGKWNLETFDPTHCRTGHTLKVNPSIA